MKVYIAGYKGAGFAGGLIRWFTFGTYSHVSFIFDDGEQQHELDALQGRGVTMRNTLGTLGEFDLFEAPCTPFDGERIFETATALLGLEYDWPGIWGFMRRKKRHNPSKWFCSELVAYVLETCGILLMRLPSWKLTPTHVCASTRITPCEPPSHWKIAA